MSTNDEVVATDDSATVIEMDLHKLKYADDGVENTKVVDEPDEVEEAEEDIEDTGEEVVTDDQATDESIVESPSFVKEFEHIKGDTPEEYAKNLEAAYRNSTSEAMRLKALADAKPVTAPAIGDDDSDDEPAPITENDPVKLWASQRMDKEITDAFEKFKVDYPQVSDTDKYEQFTNEVRIFSRTILDSQGRMASPDELYSKAAISLGWDKQSVPSPKEKLGMAVKQSAASTKVSASGAKITPQSKVTEAQISVYRRMHNVSDASKSDSDIRKELESYIS